MSDQMDLVVAKAVGQDGHDVLVTNMDRLDKPPSNPQGHCRSKNGAFHYEVAPALRQVLCPLERDDLTDRIVQTLVPKSASRSVRGHFSI